MHSHDPRALLDGWRDSGADRADPVRFRFIESMARRACGYQAEARLLLEARVAALVADYGDMLAGGSCEAVPVDTPPQRPSAVAELAALSERLGRGRYPFANATAQTPGAAQNRAHHAEPELADYFRDIWARVSVDMQLRQAQAGVPEKAGPLNTDHLVHRSLSLMREVSPGYLEQFLSYVDTLSWLEGMHDLSLVSDRDAQRAPAPRKARTKPGNTGSGVV